MLNKLVLAFGTIALFNSFLAVSAENYRHHLDYCKPLTGEPCYSKIKRDKKNLKAYTPNWYSLTGYQLDYLYDQLKFKQVEALSYQVLAQKEALPVLLETQIYFYLSKSILAIYKSEEKKAQAKMYADRAYKLLNEFEQAFSDPMRVIEIANLKHIFGDSQEAFDILYRLQRKHQSRKDALFHTQVNMNMAHALHNMQRYEEALHYRKICADWSLKLADNHFIAVSLGNLARTHQLLGNYKEADKVYRDAVTYYDKPNDSRSAMTVYLRLAEINRKLKQHKQAKHFFNKIKYEYLLHYYHTNFQELAIHYQT